VWNYSADFPIEEASGLDIKIEASQRSKVVFVLANLFLTSLAPFQVFDFDNGSEDDFLGRTSIPVTSIMDTDTFDR
jgi:hypothetical protein